MTRKPSGEIGPDALETLTILLANGFNEEVRAFTKNSVAMCGLQSRQFPSTIAYRAFSR